MLLSFSYAIKLTLAKSSQTLSTPPRANRKRKRSQEFEDPVICAPAKQLQTSGYDANTNQLDSYFLAMADPSRLEIIKSNPIGEGLTTFRDAFKSTYADLGVPGYAGGVQQIDKRGDVH
jgi:hypothetical protein